MWVGVLGAGGNRAGVWGLGVKGTGQGSGGEGAWSVGEGHGRITFL